MEVDQLVLEQALVGDGEPAGRHEPAGREGGQADLGGPALGREPPLDDGERALGHASVAGSGSGNQTRRRWSRHVVVELDGDPDEVVAGAQLEERLDGHVASSDARRRPRCARASGSARVISSAPRTGPRSSAITVHESAPSTTASVAGGE